MLNELVGKIKINRQNRINEFHQINQEIEQLNEINIGLEAEISNILAKQEKLSLEVYKKRNFIQRFIYEHFSKDYKLGQKEVEKYNEQMISLREKIKKNKEKIENLKEKKEDINIEEDQQLLETLSDRDSAIEYLIQTYPELCEKEEFMEDIVKHDLKYVIYDKTDSDKVYIEVVNQAKERSKNISEERLEKIIQEFERKMQEEPNQEIYKYIIPKKYYFEAIRKKVECIGKDESLAIVPTEEDMLNEIEELYKLDGKLPKEYGEQIQTLYEDENNYLLKHLINHSNIHVERENIINIKEKIFKEGLKIPQHNIEGNNITQLSNTTVGNYVTEVTFKDFLRPNPTILISIPKGAIKENGEFIFGADKQEIFSSLDTSKHNPAYLLPEHVIGYIDDSEGMENVRFEPNNVENKKQYAYKLRLGESQGTKVEDIDKSEERRTVFVPKCKVDEEQAIKRLEENQIKGNNNDLSLEENE